MTQIPPPSRRPSAVDLPLKGGGEERSGRLAENILYFARALRAAGIPVGPGSVLDCLEALRVAHVGTSSVRYEIGIFRNDDQAAAAQGHFVHVYVERASNKPMPLSDKHKKALEGLRA